MSVSSVLPLLLFHTRAVSYDVVARAYCSVRCPNVNPRRVKVNADADGIAAPAVVMTMDVSVVAPHVAVKPETLLAPAATTGVTVGVNKEAG